MSLFNAINNNNNNQETKLKLENYVKRLEELESVVEKQSSDVKFFVPSNPIIGVSAVGVGLQADGEDDDDEEEEEDDDDDDATREILDMTMDDGGGILDDTDDG